VATFAREIWERFQTAGRRPRRRGTAPRRRRGRRPIESLEPRLFLSADVASYRVAEIAPAEVGPVASGSRPVASHVSTLWAWDDAGNSIPSSNHPGFAEYEPASIDPAPPPSGPAGVALPPEDGPPTPDELAALPRAPWSTNYSYTGASAALDMDSAAIRIPVGPRTRGLTLGLRPERDGDDAPRIDKVLLLDRGGGLLSRIGGAAILGDHGEQVFHISVRGAPIGGEIVVFLIPASLPTASPFPAGGGEDSLGNVDPAAGAAPAPGESYFELSIQRDDDGELDVGAPPPADGGATYIATLGRAELSTSIDRSPPMVDGATPPSSIAPEPRGPVVTIAARRPVARIDAIDYGPEEVFLGPLVSRTAAPLGPVLATSVGEPTPATDRGARSAVDSRTPLGDDLDLDVVLAASGRAGTAAAAGPLGGARALATLRGPGGVPIMVAGLRLGDDSAAAEDDLAASVLGAAQDAPAPVDPPTADARRDDVARAGFATRALGFLVGMCLASGPLYPDLAALARRKFRRVRRRAAAGRSTAGRLNSGPG